LKLFGRIVYIDFIQSEISIDKVELGGVEIFNISKDDKYFLSYSEDSSLRKDGYDYFSSLLDPLTDTVLLLDNDRYFVKEYDS
jgi:hypothetical protein